MRTGNPGHLKGFDYVGFHRYSLTFCTNGRRLVFTSSDVVNDVLEQIARAADATDFAILAYCFMPDHVHLLVEGRSEASNCKRFISHAKQLSGFNYSKSYGERLWQRYGFEHVLRDDELMVVVARYILANPVRARLVERVKQYPFVGSLVYTMDELLDGIRSA